MKRLTRWLLAALVLGAAGFAGWRGWQWRANVKVQQVTVEGAQHAVPDSLRALAAVDTSDALYGIDPYAVAERVQRHPWVQSASVTRRPPGTLALTVTERTPVALALTDDGTPSYYLDDAGYRMPADAPGSVYDVPLLRGTPAYQPAQPVSGDTLQALLALLAHLDDGTETLLSELTLKEDGAVTARTIPAPDNRGALRLKLGRRPWRGKLERLQAFWKQAVLPQPGTAFEHVDLRFDDQIVTREHEREEGR